MAKDKGGTEQKVTVELGTCASTEAKPAPEPADELTLTHVIIDGMSYVLYDNVSWPASKLNKGRAQPSGAFVEAITVDGHVVDVMLRAADAPFNGQVVHIRRHLAGCTIYYEGKVPQEMPESLRDRVDGGILLPPQMKRAEEQPSQPRVEREIVLIQETLGEVEALVNKRALPQPEQVNVLRRGLASDYVDPERKEKIKRFLNWIEREQVEQQRLAAERKRKTQEALAQ